MGEGESGERSINIYTLSGMRWIAGEKLLCSTASPVLCSDDLEGWDGRKRGRLGRVGMADLHRCMAEIT